MITCMHEKYILKHDVLENKISKSLVLIKSKHSIVIKVVVKRLFFFKFYFLKRRVLKMYFACIHVIIAGDHI